MQIVCPTCTTAYQIADAAIGADGRAVRCARCHEIWHATAHGAAVHGAAVLGAAEPGDEVAAVAAFRAELGMEPPASEPPDEALSSETMIAEAAESPSDEAVADWAEAPPLALSEIPIPTDETRPRASQAGGGEGTTPIASLDDLGPPDIESVAARRARLAARNRASRWRIPLPGVIAALAVVCAALLGMRKDVVKHAPQLASFYSAIGLPVNLRGVVFTDMKIGNEIHDGVPVLVIEGTLVSTTSKAVEVPRLRFALRNAAGAEVYSWTAQPAQAVLEPFDTMAFRSRLASPPAEGHDIQVRFFTRRDAVASR